MSETGVAPLGVQPESQSGPAVASLQRISSEGAMQPSLYSKHRRMHSDGFMRLFDLKLRSSNDKDSTSDEDTKPLADFPNTDGVRKRRFPEFCLFSDSSSQGTTYSALLAKPPSPNFDPKLNDSPSQHHTVLTHRRSASHSGDFLSLATHEISEVASRVVGQAEELVIHLWNQGWKVVHHHSLPLWLRDNDFLLCGHRPELASFRKCFRSIFRVHTETGNIWTHLIGFVCFLLLSISFLLHPGLDLHWQEQVVIQVFFVSAILALGFSWLFHTVYCHSERVGRLFSKLDYVGIALLVIGSFVPWLHYSFYCHAPYKLLYMFTVLILGSICAFVSLQDSFSTPRYRAARAVLFIGLGLSAVIPCTHYVLMEGFLEGVSYSALGWLVLMAVLYISGATIYALRIPERLYPGKFDIWFQSHQIFHVFVVLAALVHLNGIMEIAEYRRSKGGCS